MPNVGRFGMPDDELDADDFVLGSEGGRFGVPGDGAPKNLNRKRRFFHRRGRFGVRDKEVEKAALGSQGGKFGVTDTEIDDAFLTHPDEDLVPEGMEDGPEVQELRALFPDGDPEMEGQWKELFDA